ncbi:CLAVATA3/ESR (CLE)-related protein 45 [Cucumis melo var. makuwa]|uniref:CLAVATA3/ESR (CLE)-related protein 45 n=1 Tax=Cucumis melo var. makuwa TaxID=1194695 RepID=A0A5A7SRV2_CUCMM|nr:CLAVATA3/ESR (CLE)-related protein 45 [Cucumis melo var. makuwa]TYK17075.1 CLAVATA3/ESR (CLE)-related protein 45 [Cucumis melo var. makuwa]
MVFSIHRVLIVLLMCVALLAVKPEQACALRSIDLALRPSRHILVEDSRVEELNMKRNSLPQNNKFDPNRSSKRRVRRGSDPIHNRS